VDGRDLDEILFGFFHPKFFFCFFPDYSCFLTLLQCWDVEKKNEEKIKANFTMFGMFFLKQTEEGLL
jgi:hypothetical protein